VLGDDFSEVENEQDISLFSHQLQRNNNENLMTSDEI
jgi:hypothetical protein